MLKRIKQKLYSLLIWSQKYTKTDMVYLAKGGFWLNLNQGITSLVGLALTIAFANLLLPDTYGTFKFVISFVAILSIPTLTGINSALVRAVAQGNEGTFYPALKVKLKWGLLGAIGGLMLAGYYFYNDNTTLGFSFLIMAGFIPFFNTIDLWISYLNGKKNFKASAEYQSALKILSVVTMIITIIFTQNLFLILFIHFTSNSLFRSFFLWLTLKKFPPNKNHDPKSIGYGKHLSLMGILGTVASQIDKILIFHFLGPVQVAVYAFALKPVEKLRGPLNTLGNLALPKLSQRKVTELKKSIPGKMIKLFLLLLPAVVCYIFLAPYFFQFFLPQYTEAIIYSQIFALTLVFFPKFLLGQTLLAHANKKELYIIRTLTPIFKITLFLILLPIYGIWGAIITLLVAQIFNLLILVFFFQRIKAPTTTKPTS